MQQGTNVLRYMYLSTRVRLGSLFSFFLDKRLGPRLRPQLGAWAMLSEGPMRNAACAVRGLVIRTTKGWERRLIGLGLGWPIQLRPPRCRGTRSVHGPKRTENRLEEPWGRLTKVFSKFCSGLVHFPIPTQNIFSSIHHIKSFNACMEH
jgi:hypothetical protein